MTKKLNIHNNKNTLINLFITNKGISTSGNNKTHWYAGMNARYFKQGFAPNMSWLSKHVSVRMW